MLAKERSISFADGRSGFVLPVSSVWQADEMGRKVLKGLRWLLLKFQGDLNESKNERQRLMDALGLNQSLAIAYYLKEDLAQMWQQPRQGCCQHLSERLVWPCPGVRNKGPASNGTVVIVSYFTCSVYAIQLGARRVASASAGNRDGGA